MANPATTSGNSKMPVQTPPKSGATHDHPAVREHIAHVSNMAYEIDKLRQERDQLRHDLDVERRFTAELQHSVDHERLEKERYQRYAVKSDSYLSQLAELALQAREGARDMAATAPPPAPQIEQQQQQPETDNLAEIDASIAAIAKKWAPRPE